jgi:hypothetical protein
MLWNGIERNESFPFRKWIKQTYRILAKAKWWSRPPLLLPSTFEHKLYEPTDMKRRSSTKGENSPPSSPPPTHKTPPATTTTTTTTNNNTKGSSHKELKAHHVFHQDLRASLLSTEAPAQNYRGLINLVMLILVFTLFLFYFATYLQYYNAVCNTHSVDHGEHVEVWDIGQFNKYLR